jgi:hypothetical protein
LTETTKPETVFSAIKLLPLLEKKIAKIDKYPLSKENFVIQQDVYKRLGSLDDESLDEQPEAFEAFATLESARKEKDTDLRFAMELSAIGILLSIEGIGSLFFLHADCFKDEKDATEQIMTFLQMAANGQLACLITTRNGRDCASEFLAFEKGKSTPDVLATEGNYSRFWKKDDETGYESQVMRNRYLDDQVEIPKDIFFIDRDKDGKFLQKGRIFKKNDLSPLTKKAYWAAMEQIGNRLVGQKEGEDEWGRLSRSWEFWFISAAIGALIFFASFKGYIPKFFSDIPFIIVPIATTIGAYFATHLIIRKNAIKENNPESTLVKAENSVGNTVGKVSKHIYTIFGVLTVGVLFATNFMPIYVPLDSSQNITLWEVAKNYYAPAYIAPALFLAAFYLAFIKKKLAGILYFLCVLLGIAGLFFVNFGKMNPDVSTPEPYTSVAMISYLAAPIIALFMMISRLRNPAKDAMNSYTEITGDSDIEQLSAEDIKKGQRKLKRGRVIQTVIGYFGGIALIVSGYLYKDIPDASLTFNNHRILMAILMASGVIILIGITLFQKRKLSASNYGWITSIIVLILFIGWNEVIKDGANEGSDLAWILMFVSGMLLIFTSAITEQLEKYNSYNDTADHVFEDKDKKS